MFFKYPSERAGPLTIFGPSDTALSKLPREEVQKLVTDKDYLRVTLLRHVLAEGVSTSDFKEDLVVDNFGGEMARLNVYKKSGAGDVRQNL